MGLLLISDSYSGGISPADGLGDAAIAIPAAWVPTPDEAAAADTIIVFGVGDADQAIQIAGALRHALAKGRTVVLAYRVRLDGGDLRIYQQLVERVTPNSLPSGRRLSRPHPAFREYVRAYGGSCATRFFQVPEGAETLAGLDDGQTFHPSALAIPVEQGLLYVIPWHVASFNSSHADLTRALLAAVKAHQSGGVAALPAFLSDARLHGEQELLDDIATYRGKLAQREAEAEPLERLRHMVGHIQGDALEAVVIDALNVVLGGTDYRAEDREDVSREDFWIVSSNGDDALAEVKAMGGGVSQEAVSRVSVHRGEGGHEIEELPGLLIANQYRGDDDFERRRHAPPPNVLSQLRYQNVLLLRTVDLYELVSRKRAGQDVGQELIDALHAGGGWLEATADAVVLREP